MLMLLEETSIFIAWQDKLNNGDNIVDYLYDDLKHGLNNYELILHKGWIFLSKRQSGKKCIMLNDFFISKSLESFINFQYIQKNQ